MENLDFKVIGTKIKERRNSQHVTQEAVANYLDINSSHISNIETGKAHPSLSTLIHIANYLECSIDYFIGHEYTFEIDEEAVKSVDDKIMDKLKYCDYEKKNKILQMIDLL